MPLVDGEESDGLERHATEEGEFEETPPIEAAGRRLMCPASIQLLLGGRSIPTLPKPSLPAERATDRRRLNTPLKSLAAALAPDRLLIDCGGEGQCGPNTLAFLLGLLGRFEGDGYGLRCDVVRFVRSSNVLDHKTAFAWKAHPDSHLTCRDLLIENMKGWPRDVIGGRPLSADTWCAVTLARDAWTDLTFVQLCASLFKVTINIIGVDDLGQVYPTFPVEPTPPQTPSEAACDMGCWFGNHFVAVVDCEPPTQDFSAGDGAEQALNSGVDAGDATNVNSRESSCVRASSFEAETGNLSEPPGDNPTATISSAEAHEAEPPPAIHRSVADVATGTVDLRVATQWVVALLHVAVLVQPLVYAHVNGFMAIGAALPVGSPKKAAMKTAQRLCDTMWGHKVYTFLAGVHLGGWKLFATPVDYAPPESTICRSAAQRARLAAQGASFMWMTLSALQATVCYSAAAQAMLSVQCFVKPPSMLSELALSNADASATIFKTGAISTTSRLGLPALDNSHRPIPWIALEKLQRQDGLLKELLLTQEDPQALLEGWAEQIKPAALDEIPSGLLSSLPSFHDPQLSLVELPPSPKPYRTPWVPLAPQQPQPSSEAPSCPKLTDLLLPATLTKMRRWFKAQLDDLLRIREQLQAGSPPDSVRRERPKAIAIGQTEVAEWARGIVWDCRAQCCRPLDFASPFSTDLKLSVFTEWLGCYPDQTLMAYLTEGVRLDADVELQAVLVPHLMSLSRGFRSVDSEIRRLEAKGWYDFYEDMPFFPMYFNGQGAVARKLEPDRFRRSTEGGGPRKRTTDADGLEAISLNSAAKIKHLPRYFQQDSRPQFRRWLALRGLQGDGEEAMSIAPHCEAKHALSNPNASIPPIPRDGTKSPAERKPNIAMLLVALAVLCRAAHVLDAPIYIFSDDAKDYFNQLGMATEELWKLGVVFLRDIDVESPHAVLNFISEKRLGFGTHSASNTAQRFSDALLQLFRDRMDEREATIPPDTEHPNWDEWQRVRTQVQASSKQDCGRTRSYAASDSAQQQGIRVCPQLRLYHAMMYTDDPIFVVVGAQRAVRALEEWRKLTREVNLEMAIPEKRTLGSWAVWLGVIIFAPLGIVVIPRSKLLRAAATITQVLAHGCTFDVYRSLCGLLEHFRAVNLRKRDVMHGLYAPHKADGVKSLGPGARVKCDTLMRKQLQRWLQLTFHTGGVDVRSAVLPHLTKHMAPITVILDSDACHGDGPSGMGGYMHGAYWYFAVPKDDYPVVTTPLLELMGLAFNILIFHEVLSKPPGTILLRTDALTNTLTLPEASMKSEASIRLYQALIQTEAWKDLAPRMVIQHLHGDSNVMADAISRARWTEFTQRCRQLRIRPTLVQIEDTATRLYQQVVRPQSPMDIDLAGFIAGSRINMLSATAGTSGVRTHLTTDSTVSGNPPARTAAAMLAHATTTPASTPSSSPVDQKDSEGECLNNVGVRTATRMLTDGHNLNIHRQLFAATANAKTNPPANNAQRQLPSTPTRLIAGIHVAQTPTPAHQLPALTAASRHMARLMADTFKQGEEGMQFGLPAEQVAALSVSIQEGVIYGINANTGETDERAWVMWMHVCAQYRTSPYRSATEVQQFPQRNAHLMGALLMHAFAMGQPRDKTKHFIRPRSAMAYVLAIRRIFKRWSIQLPPHSALKASLAHLSRLYLAYHGQYSLAPQRAEPMKFATVIKINSLGNVCVAGRTWTDDDHDVFMFRRLNCVMWPTGFRLGEIVAHTSHEVMYLTFESLTWCIQGEIVTTPSELQMRALVPGKDFARLAPPRSKPDQWGEIHCPYPAALTFHDEPANAAAALRDLELKRMTYTTPAPRSQAALFHDKLQQPYTHAYMDRMLKSVLQHCYGHGVAALFTWHSYRSGLATALHAAGVEDGLVMLICRWMCPQSLHVYRRMGTDENERCVRRAMLAKVDLIQAGNVPKVTGDHGYAQLFREAADGSLFAAAQSARSRVSAATEVATTAAQCDGSTPASHPPPSPPQRHSRETPARLAPAAANHSPRARQATARPPQRGARAAHSTRAPPAKRRRTTVWSDAVPPQRIDVTSVAHVRHQFPSSLAAHVVQSACRSTRPPPRDRYGVNRDVRGSD